MSGKEVKPTAKPARGSCLYEGSTKKAKPHESSAKHVGLPRVQIRPIMSSTHGSSFFRRLDSTVFDQDFRTHEVQQKDLELDPKGSTITNV